MMIVGLLMGSLLLWLSINVIKSDLTYGLVYNKVLLRFAFAGGILDVIYYVFFAKEYFLTFLMNFFIILVLSLLFFYTKSFAGGDCKLMMVMALLYPANYCLIYRNSSVTLFFAIGIGIIYGYIYLVVSSVYRVLKKKSNISCEYIKSYVFNFFRSFLLATVYVYAISICCMIFDMNGVYIYDWIIRAICFLVAFLVGKYQISVKWHVLLPVLLFDVIMSIKMRVFPFSADISNYCLLIIVLLCQMTIKTSLYEEVSIKDLKKGMILSTMSSLRIQNSRIKGLPGISTEDLGCRITNEEVESIKRWGEKKQIESLTIVRKIPFATFIALGFVTYFSLWGYL